jgi:hypothetical protein
MRYHWGLGVGHTYAYQKTTLAFPAENSDAVKDNDIEKEVEGDDVPSHADLVLEGSGSPPASDGDQTQSEDDRDDDDLRENDSDITDDGRDDEDLLAMDDMYDSI